MGSPLEPVHRLQYSTPADIFMSEFARKHMKKLKELGNRIWKHELNKH